MRSSTSRAPGPRLELTYRTARAELRIQFPGPGLLHTVFSGHGDVEGAKRIIRAGDEVIRSAGRLTAFHDWEHVTSYDSDCRTELTNWGVRIRREVDTVHVLVRSRLAKMGVAVASLVLGDMIRVYNTRGEFEAAFRSAIAPRA